MAKITYERWFSVAVGAMGMTPDVFDSMTVAHFIYACVGYNRNNLERQKALYECVRWSTWINVSSQMTRAIPMHDLLPLPWDRATKTKSIALSDAAIAERCKRAKEFLDAYKKGVINE